MGSAASAPVNPSTFLSKITVDQGPEFEQTLNFAALTQVSTPTSLRTDRKIKFIDLHFRGRLTNASTGPTLRTAPTLLATQVFSLIQQVTIRGVHLRYGNQAPIQMRGETIAEMAAMMLGANYVPFFSVGQNGAAAVIGGALDTTASHTNDIEFVLPIPLFPYGLAAGDATLHCLHGPDWPGNLYVDILFADGSALATANPPATFTAYGSNSGTPTLDILTERPAPGKDLASKISPAVLFRTTNFSQPTAAVAGTSGSGVKLADLIVGKDTTRLWLKCGTQASGNSSGVVTYGSLLDSIVTRTFFSLDNRPLRFQNANDNAALKDYMGRSYYRTIPAGYTAVDFIQSPARGAGNSSAVFGSSQLTAARQFQMNGDVTAASNQIAEIIQEMLLGQPQVSA